MKPVENEYVLDRAGVDAVSQDIYDWMQEVGVERRTAIRLRMTAEEVLLRISEHYQETKVISLCLKKRFSTSTIRFRYEGESYNPTDAREKELDELAGRIMSSMGLTPSWSYRGTYNELMLRIPSSGFGTDWIILGSLAAAIVVGILGGLLPEAFKQPVSAYVLIPLSDAFLRLLNTFAGLMIFLSITTGICGIGSASDFGKIGKTMFSRFFGFTFLCCALCIMMTAPFFNLTAGSISGKASPGQDLLNIIMDILPSDPVTPFSEGNMLQIILLAILISVVLLRIGTSSLRIRERISDCSMVILETVHMICKLLPVYIFTSLTNLLWKNGIQILLQLWKPIVLTICFFVIALSAKVLITCTKLKIRPIALLRTLLPGMLIGYATSSSAMAYSTCMDVADKKLGVAPELSHTAIPMGILYGSVSAALFVIIAFYTAETCQTPVNWLWFFLMFVLSSILDVATPPVAGGTLICIKTMLVQLGMPASALAIAATLSIILDFFSTGTRIGMLQMEMMLQAEKLGLLNKDILYANIPKR